MRVRPFLSEHLQGQTRMVFSQMMTSKSSWEVELYL